MPLYGIMSDIHANLAALKDAFAVFEQHRVERIYCIGDIVGYGAEPEECCRLVRDTARAVVAGNHDHAVCDRFDYFKIFSPSAIIGVQYAKQFLLPDSLRWLNSLGLIYEDSLLQMVHGSLKMPDLFYYIRNGSTAFDEVFQDVSLTFDRMTRPLCFVGHSHRPVVYIEEPDGEVAVLPASEDGITMQGRRAVINAGSVGTPRTPDRLGCVIIYDTESDTVFYRKFPVKPSIIPDWIVAKLDWPDT